MNRTQQGLYAANFHQNLGYPLRLPNGGNKADVVGVRIGDVGHVDQYGEFRIHCDIRRLREDFQRVEKLGRSYPFAVHPGPRTTGVEQQQTDSSTVYEFTTTSREGAILILPSGAKLLELQDQQKLDEIRSLAVENAIEWCRSARQDSLYLITGVYQTRVWALGAFHKDSPHGVIHVKESDKALDNNVGPKYEHWSAFSMDFQSCLKGNDYENQTVFIKGFKMTPRRAAIEIEHVEGWRSDLTSFVISFVVYLTWLLGVSSWRPPFVHIEYHPRLSQPMHYLDHINQYLLEKSPEAQVAVTHDDVWINMLEGSPSGVMEVSELRERLEREYDVRQLDHKAVCLQRRSVGCNDVHQKSESSQSMSMTENTQIVITHIRAENVAVGLGRVPVGFFVQIGVDGNISKRTKNVSTLVLDHVIQWDDPIDLPSNLSTVIQLTVCASFGFSPMLGGGEPLGTLEISVGDLLRRTDPFASSEMKEAISSSLSLLISVQRWHRGPSISNQVNAVVDREECLVPAEVTNATDKGQEALLHYHKNHTDEDLQCSIEHFKRALDNCHVENACRAAALFNLAKAECLTYQSHGTLSDFDNAVSHYQEALKLRHSDHPDRPMTLLYLSQAFLHHYDTMGNETSTEDKISGRVDELRGLCGEGSHERRAADLALQTYKRLRLMDSDDSAELNKLIPELDTAAHQGPETYFDQPIRFNNIGLALLRRFQLDHNASDLDEAVEWFEKAEQMTPQSHPERPSYLKNLGDALLVRFQQQNAVPITKQL